MTPEQYLLSLRHWQFFCTLTFDSRDKRGNWRKVPCEGDRQKMLFAFLRKVAAGQTRDKISGKALDRVPYDYLEWASRAEVGERTGRDHFHILLSGLPFSRCNTVERFAIKAIWRALGGGHADIRVFDPRLRGVVYVLKGLDSLDWNIDSANSYEIAKFKAQQDRTLIIANACWKKWQQALRMRWATRGTRNPISGASSLSDRRKLIANRTKETPAYRDGLFIPNMHPAGVSFVQ